VRALAAGNAALDTRDRVTIDSVRTHATNHFPVQSVAKATYRDIVERRALENRVDFVEGVATALTPLAFYEVAMNKAFRALVDDGTEVSVETGLRAAEKLQSVLDDRARDTNVLELKVVLDRIGQAVRAVVPQPMWSAILEKLEELEQDSEALDVGTDSTPRLLSRLKVRGEISLKMANGGEFATSMRNRWIGSVSDGRETSRGVYGRRSLRCASVAKRVTRDSLPRLITTRGSDPLLRTRVRYQRPQQAWRPLRLLSLDTPIG
jgi:hypothetical protein